MPEEIPEEWKKCVVVALRTQDPTIIQWTPQALQRWKADTFGAWDYEAFDALANALSFPCVEGNQTTPHEGQAAAYEFLFHRGSKLMYAKIALKADKVRILILSAHNAKRSSL